MILDWALKLEEQGVMRQTMNFTPTEKQVAHFATYQVVKNIGNMSNSLSKEDFFTAICSLTSNDWLGQPAQILNVNQEQFGTIQLDSNQEDELRAEVITIEAQLASPKPKPVIIIESLNSIRSILEGNNENVVANDLLTQFASLSS